MINNNLKIVRPEDAILFFNNNEQDIFKEHCACMCVCVCVST